MKQTETLQALGLKRAFWSVAICGVVATLSAPLVFGGFHAGVSAGIGAAIALFNLWSIAHLVRGFLAPSGLRLPWALMASVKMFVLLGAIYALLTHDWVALFPLVMGFGALPVGIVFGQAGLRGPAHGELKDA